MGRYPPRLADPDRLLIALLAVVRKLIVVDFHELSPAALAGLLLSLGVTYWLMRERDDRLPKARRQQSP